MHELLTYSATKLSELIRKKEVTSSEIVNIHIEQIKKVNPLLNAVVKERFEEAQKEAKNADQIIKKEQMDKIPPFLGVPCTIKECFAFKGMPNTGGLYSRRNYIAQVDATVVQRVKEAGAIPLGITNVPELCMWMETYNTFYGRTKNPYNQKRIVGGSSGGEGAIISAGGSPFGIGSDLGGSIRMPAFFNGIFGHKPSSGLIPNTGQFPITENEALRYLTTGPLTRRAEDLMPLLKILAGPDGKDPVTTEIPLGEPLKVDIKSLSFYNVEDNGVFDVSRDLREAQKRVVKYLEEKGCSVKTIKIGMLKRSFDIWSSMLSSAGGKTYSELLGNGKKINLFFEFLKLCINCSTHTLPSLVLALGEKFPKLTPSRTNRFVEMGRELKEEIARTLGSNGIMLYPSYVKPAPYHREPLLKPFHWVYTAIVNVMEMPATQIPLGLNEKGLPLGIQAIASHGNDHITIAVALELEKAFGGWVPPEIGLLKK
jgi:fatty acid amide hydrolase 2